MTNVLEEIREGMKVTDSTGERIGTVEWVHFSDEDPTTPEAEVATPGRTGGSDPSVIDVITNAFRVDDVPEELRERLLRRGFVRIDASGIFAADRYVLPEQIDTVGDDEIVLNVDRESLIKRA